MNYTVLLKLILVRPDVEPIEKLRSRVEDETATIECKVSGFPVPQITWLVRSEESGKTL